MKTILEKIDKNQNNTDIIREAGRILKEGGLVAFPTETVYGLGADALNEDAAKKIYAAKGRPSDNPLIIHITNMKALEKIVSEVPEKAVKVAEKYWPGPLTMIFNKSDIVPYGTTGGLDTVAVRMPVDEIAREVIDAGGGYIAAPSANTSGRPSPTTAQHVAEDLTGRVDMIVDGGAVEIGVESTILDMTVEPPMILRPGAITKEMFEEVIGEVTIDRTLIRPDSKQVPKAPGMKYRHYAPKADLTIIEGPLEKVTAEINKRAKEKSCAGYKVGIIGTEETVAEYKAGDVKCIGTRADESTIAANLFGILREFDDDQVDYIYSESFDTAGIGSHHQRAWRRHGRPVCFKAGKRFRPRTRRTARCGRITRPETFPGGERRGKFPSAASGFWCRHNKFPNKRNSVCRYLSLAFPMYIRLRIPIVSKKSNTHCYRILLLCIIGGSYYPSSPGCPQRQQLGLVSILTIKCHIVFCSSYLYKIPV